MRYFYVIFCGLLARPACAQTALEMPVDSARYYLATDDRWVYSAVDSAGTCTEVLRWGEARGLVRVFYPSGKLRDYTPYADVAQGIRHGLTTTWYENGQLGVQQVYLAGRREGALWLYYEGGQLKRHTQYEAGNELPGSCFGPQGEAVPYFPYEQQPLYPGGYGQLAKEITRAMRLSRQVESLAINLGMTVNVSFWVAPDGSIRDPQVTAPSRILALDQAALAAVAKLTQRFYPGKLDGVAVRYRYHVPIEFKSLLAPRSFGL